MIGQTKYAAPLVVAALLIAGPALPCGFDAPLGNTFTPMHPKSLGVAFAVRDAVVAGVIEPAADPAAAGQAGYWRAVGHLAALQKALSAAQGAERAPVSVLFIDSGLWARLTPVADGYAMDVHTEGAKSGDVAIVTNEPVLTAVLAKKLTVADALDRGLIALDGAEAVAIERLLVYGFGPEGRSHPPPAMRPGTLFGPRVGVGAAPSQ